MTQQLERGPGTAPRQARHRRGDPTLGIPLPRVAPDAGDGTPIPPAGTPTPPRGVHRASRRGGAGRATGCREGEPRRRRLPGGSFLAAAAALLLGAGGAAAVVSTQAEESVASTAPQEPVAATGAAPVASGSEGARPTAPRTGRAPAPAAAPSLAAPVREPVLAGLSDALFDARAGDFVGKFDNNGRSGLVERAGKPRVVTGADGRSAWRFTLGAGGKRSEVLPEGRGTRPVDGDVQWVRYSAVLDENFPTDTDEWQLILQWHHSTPTGSPPLALQVTKGQLMMVSEGTDMKAIGPVSPGQRIDLVMRVAFDRDPSQGSVTVWRDGKPTGVTGWRPPDGTMSTRTAYLKMGLYRNPAIRQPGTVTVDDLKIGPTERSVGGTGSLRR